MSWPRRVVAALLVLELCANARGAEPEASPGEWKFISDKDGVALLLHFNVAPNDKTASEASISFIFSRNY